MCAGNLKCFVFCFFGFLPLTSLVNSLKWSEIVTEDTICNHHQWSNFNFIYMIYAEIQNGKTNLFRDCLSTHLTRTMLLS